MSDDPRRGPAQFAAESEGERTSRGGLVTALSGLVSRIARLWIASAMTDDNRGEP